MFVASHKHDGMPRAVASLSDDNAGERIFKIVSALSASANVRSMDGPHPQTMGIAAVGGEGSTSPLHV